jgi:hypothetical protein
MLKGILIASIFWLFWIYQMFRVMNSYRLNSEAYRKLAKAYQDATINCDDCRNKFTDNYFKEG